MSIQYIGRAESKLEPNNLLITHKTDGSLSISSAQGITPINYQRKGSTLSIHDNKLICTSKDKTEQLIITIYKIYQYNELLDWDSCKPIMNKTEKQLCTKLQSILFSIIRGDFIVHRELPSPMGPMDIVAIDSNKIWHIFEVKRNIITINTVVQLKKYCDYVGESNQYIGYVVAPKISNKAEALIVKYDYKFIKLDH